MKNIIGISIIPVLFTTATAFAELSPEAEKVMQLRKTECEADILLDTCAEPADVPPPTCMVKVAVVDKVHTYKFYRDNKGKVLPRYTVTIGDK